MGAIVARCFDSNILIDWLNGIAAAEAELDAAEHKTISIMTWIEVLAGVGSESEDEVAREFLTNFRVVPVGPAIAERALLIRRERRVRLVDSTIHATALNEGLLLVTRNTKDFSAADPTIRVPYEL